MILHHLTSSATQALDRRTTTVLLPIGSVEQHSRHLPLGTDALIVDRVASGVEQRLSSHVVLCPTTWYGASDHHLARAGTTSIGSDALVMTIVGVIESLHRSSGWRKFLVLNGHGGNQPAARIALERVHRRCPDVMAWMLNYWDAMFAVLDSAGTSRPSAMGHADAVETAIAMSCFPQHVRAAAMVPDDYRDELPPWVHSTDGIPERTEYGGVGDPTPATADLGASLLAAAVEGVTALADKLLTL